MLRSTTLAAGLFASAAAHATAPFVPLTDGQGVRIARTVFVDGQDVAHNTAEGVLEIDPQRLAAVTGQARGFVHVVTDVGTVAWNIPVDALPAVPPALQRQGIRPTPAPVMQVPFALASPRAVSSLKAKVVFTPAAVLDAGGFASVTVAPATKWQVKALPEIIGGHGPGSIQAPPLPPLPPGPPSIGDLQEGGFTPEWQHILPNPENVDAARRQCGPAAMANALAYLAETFHPLGEVFYHDHVRGLPGMINLVGLQDALMHRPVTDTCNGENTMTCNGEGSDNPSSYIRGIFTYLDLYDEEGLVTVAHQGGNGALPGACGDGGGDHTSATGGDQPTFDWICERIGEGASVVLAIGYYKIDNYIQSCDENGCGGYFTYERTGGHMARAWGCGQIGEQRFVRLLDDGQQDRMIDTDDDEETDTCEVRDGLRTQLFYVDEESQGGQLLLGGLGRQVEFALAITPNL